MHKKIFLFFSLCFTWPLITMQKDEQQNLLSKNKTFSLDIVRYPALQKGYELAGLSFENLDSDNEDPSQYNHDEMVDAQQIYRTIHELDETLIATENSIQRAFIKNDNYRHRFCSVLENIIDNNLDLYQNHNPLFQYGCCSSLTIPHAIKICTGKLLCNHDNEPDQVFQYCRDTPFMKPVIIDYVTSFYRCYYFNKHMPYLIEKTLSKDNAEIMKFFIESGFFLDRNSQNCLLLRSAQANYYNIMKLLLTKKAEIQFRDHNDNNCLHYATDNDDPKTFKFLLDAGALVDQTNNQGQTPLHCACRYGSEQIIPLLLAARAQVNKQDNNGKTPLHHACECQYDRTIIEDNNWIKSIMIPLLIDAGANFELLDNHGYKPGYENSTSQMILKQAVAQKNNLPLDPWTNICSYLYGVKIKSK